MPAAAAAMDASLKAGMPRFVRMVANIETSLVFVLNPGTPMAQGVTVVPDMSPGALPNSFLISGPYDGNGDGFNETTISGRATFNSDPGSAWTGLNGQIAVDVGIPIIGHVYHGDIAMTITSAERRLSGTGRFTDPLSGNATMMMAAAGAPLVVRPATGAAGAVANACGYSLEGQLRFDVTGPAGTLTSFWNFSPNDAGVPISGTVFTDTAGRTTALADSTADLRCGSGGSVNDWAFVFDQSYSCLPRESGRATLTLTATAPDTITIVDEDPPGSGSSKTYQATLVAGNPHAVRGFFIGGPAGNRYREDFNWTLAGNGRRFSQISSYSYIEGPLIGTGGFCVASATR